MNNIIRNLKFKIEKNVETIKNNVEYQWALIYLAIEDWYNLIVADPETIHSKPYTYGNFWNGALDLDINVYNRFLD